MSKVAFYTLGCKANYADTEALKTIFESCNYEITSFENLADVYVINTCTVTHNSDRKSRQIIRRARRRAPGAIIAVTGCYPQVNPDELEKMPEVDLVTGTNRRHLLPVMIEQVGGEKFKRVAVEPFGESPVFEKLPFYQGQSRTRAFLKVQEGCDQRCSYCLVPLARGPVRSKPPGEIIDDLYRLATLGYREVVFTGIHLGLYGQELQGHRLAGLLKRAEEVKDIHRIRLSSLEPSDFTGELIEVIASSYKVCRHLHIPLQSGDDEILTKMYRPYNTAEFAFLVGRLRSLMPGLAVSTDLIVGFPGETRDHHRRSMEFVRHMQFSRMHVFRYSPRPGTDASKFTDQVSHGEQVIRSKEMEELAGTAAWEYRRSFLGSRQEVLVEKAKESGEIEGLTEHYLRVKSKIKGDARDLQGQMVIVELQEDDPEEDILTGEVYSRA